MPTTPKREKVARMPDPCNILGGLVEKAALVRDWKRPVGLDIKAGPNLTVKATECKYKDKTNPNARIAVEFQTQSATLLVDRWGAGFDKVDLGGRNAYVRYVAGTDTCGVIVDFSFGMMIVAILNDNTDHCQRAVDIAKVVEPWFSQWE